jgi:Predicted glycosyltransferases
MNNNIKVSIVTPSYNQGQFIEETILSILNQTYKNIEYIIVDGGSTDNTMEIINKYKDKIDIIISEKDNGQTDAINKGFRLSLGTLVGWINSDDFLYPECVERLVKKYIEYPNAAIYYNASLDYIDENSKYIRTNHREITNKEFLLRTNFAVIQPTSFYNRELVKKADYLDEKIRYCMDLDLWLKLLEHGDICKVGNISLGAFRVWQLSKTSNEIFKFLPEIRKTLLKHGAKITDKSVRSTFSLIFRFRIESLKKIIKKNLV